MLLCEPALNHVLSGWCSVLLERHGTQVGQLFESEVIASTFSVADVINPFAKKDTKFYPDVSCRCCFLLLYVTCMILNQ